MLGFIFLWSGAIADIPDGWQICDGTNGTPNLKNRFLVVATDTYAIDETGGAATHTHSFTGDDHTHDLGGGPDLNLALGYDNTTLPAAGVGDSDAGDTLAPYIALAYIGWVGQ